MRQMDLPKNLARRKVALLYLQIAAAIVSLIIGLATISKESAPLMEKIEESQRQALARTAQMKALEISRMGIPWQYRGNDGTWRYYSDATGRYWCRVNIEGVQEYSENPQIQMHIASSPATSR